MVSNTIKEKQFMDKLYEKLTQGDIKSSFQVYDRYVRIYGSDFIDKILKPVMGRIEEELDDEKISVATEHVAKNIASTLAKIIRDKQNKDTV